MSFDSSRPEVPIAETEEEAVIEEIDSDEHVSPEAKEAVEAQELAEGAEVVSAIDDPANADIIDRLKGDG